MKYLKIAFVFTTRFQQPLRYWASKQGEAKHEAAEQKKNEPNGIFSL